MLLIWVNTYLYLYTVKVKECSADVTYSNFCKVEVLLTLDTVGLVEVLMFGAWCNAPVFGGMICLLDNLTQRNMFHTRDTEQKVQM